MKDRIGIALLLILSLGAARPAGVFAGPIEWGLKGGVDMATPMGSRPPSVDSDVVFGLACGAFAEIGLTDHFSFQPEADYVTRGYQQTFNNIPITGSGPYILGTANLHFSYSFQFLEIPLLLKAHQRLGDGLVGGLFIGPSVSVLLGSNYHYDNSAFGSGNLAVNGNNPVFGAVAGASLEFGRYILDLRYDHGLSSDTASNGGLVDSDFSLQAGYRIQ